jgi:LacI family transcriptional regulator
MSGVNLKRLSEELGLSISSVSKALRDSYEISTETKKRVLAMAEKMNYQPNPFARGLRKRKSITIAVVIPEIANNFFALAIDGIQLVAQQKGYHVLTYLTHEKAKDQESTIKHLQGGRVDGVLISLCSDTATDHQLAALQDTGCPVVFFDRIPDMLNCPTVTTDNFEGGFKATEHLIRSGCKKIAYLRVKGYLSTTEKRMNGYQAALKKYNLPEDPKMIVECTNDDDANAILIKKVLKMKGRPDGIFSSIEKLAISTYYVCNELKLKIPEQVKIISFSCLRTASLLSPALSTITPPAFEIGKESAALLFRMIEKKTFGNRIDQIVLKSSLIERNSSLPKERTKKAANRQRAVNPA